MAHPRFDGEYEIYMKSKDPFGGECHCKGTMTVEGNTARGSVTLDPSKQNSWYCINKQLNFHLRTNVEDDKTVLFEANVHGQRLITKAEFRHNMEELDNSFQTTMLRYRVTGNTQKKTATTQPTPTTPSPL